MKSREGFDTANKENLCYEKRKTVKSSVNSHLISHLISDLKKGGLLERGLKKERGRGVVVWKLSRAFTDIVNTPKLSWSVMDFFSFAQRALGGFKKVFLLH